LADSGRASQTSRAILPFYCRAPARPRRHFLKRAATTGVTLTLALTFGATAGRAHGADLPRTPEQTFFSAPSAFGLQREPPRPFAGFRTRSLEFAQGGLLSREDIARPLTNATWRQPFAPDGSLSLASRNSSGVFATIDLANLTQPEPRWKAKDVLATGVPPRDKDSHLGETVARGMLGFVIGRAVAELVGDRKPGTTYLKVRSASDPHGKGVGLGFSASW
jgi:hypothetical protein